LRPGILHIGAVGHLRQRAPRLQIGQQHDLIWLRENVRRLGHKVHAAKDNVFGILAISRIAGQLERVAAKVGKLDHIIPLVVVAQDHKGVS
jgi:hypothetical protein